MDRYDKGHELEYEVHDEDIMVSDSYAVIDPRTVMIITINALMADNKMSGSVGSYGFAFWTQRRTINCFKKLKELHFFILKVARIYHNKANM